jgi:hypothetical protein
MYAVRDTTRECWTASFDACNLDPRKRVSFGNWCLRIGHFLQAGESFKTETFEVDPSASNIYNMLPSFWNSMTPEEKKVVVEVAAQHNNQFTVGCVKQIHHECIMSMKDMQHVRLCLECAWEHPSHLDMEQPSHDNLSEVAEGVVNAQADVMDACSGLSWFQLKPPGMTGQALLDHMFAQRQISFKTREDRRYEANSYLDLAIKPCNIAVLKHMAAPDLSKMAIMQDCAGNRATLNLAVRKLNTTGYVQHHCGLVNTDDNVMKLKIALQLSQSMDTISKTSRPARLFKRILTRIWPTNHWLQQHY